MDLDTGVLSITGLIQSVILSLVMHYEGESAARAQFRCYGRKSNARLKSWGTRQSQPMTLI
jgi:hypothetical protein